MTEQPYTCCSELSNHVDRVTWAIVETEPGESDMLALRGYTRKRGRKFCAFAKVGARERQEAEDAALALLEEHGETSP